MGDGKRGKWLWHAWHDSLTDLVEMDGVYGRYWEGVLKGKEKRNEMQ